MILSLVLIVAAFIVGKQYGARLEKEAVAVALAIFSKAKAALSRTLTRAQLDAQAEVVRLEALVKKYL